MLTELSLANFKSWRSIKGMRMAPITGLFGVNSSGKTSILQLLLMLKQTAESPDRAQALIFGDDKTPVRLGTFRDVVFGHNVSDPLSWSLTWRFGKPFRVTDPQDPAGRLLFASDSMQFDVQIREEAQGRIVVDRMAYRLGENNFEMRLKAPGAKYDLAAVGTEFYFVRNVGRPWDLPAPVKCYGFPDEVKAYYQNAGFLADLQLKFEQLLGATYYLGPLRDYPKREYPWARAEPADMGQRGERVVEALLAAKETGRTISLGRGHTRRTLEEHVAWWLKQLGLIHDFHVEPVAKDSSLYRVKVQRSSSSAPVLITDVGFGVSQILPVIALCYYVPEGSTVILEQPEIHLHPSVQAGLADVFIDVIKRRSVQIIFESHSEHLLRRLQRRIAEEEIKPDQATLYFCDMPEGASRITPLELDMFGHIANWPKDFFGDEFTEVVEASLSAMKRKGAGGQ